LDTKKSRLLWFKNLGKLDYGTAWKLQKRLVQLRLQGEIPDTLLLVEHPPTITLGRTAHAENLRIDPAERVRRRIALFSVDRGGDVTFHGPGQLVGYPVIDLQNHRPDVLVYLRSLEDVLIRSLKPFGIAADRLPGYTGVWVQNEKIAAIGVRVSRWITSHGFALNVNTNLDSFDWIVPCGIRDKKVTSMEKILGHPLDLGAVREEVKNAFRDVFNGFLQEAPDWIVKSGEDERQSSQKDEMIKEDGYAEIKKRKPNYI